MFFNIKGHFKQQVVLSRSVPFDERPDPLKIPVPDVDIHGAESATGEGRKRLVMHIVRERDRKLVAQKKASVDPATCEVCGFNSREKYDVDYCEVHHLIPLADLEEGTKTKLDDLAIVCANCHRILHLQYPPMTLEKLRRQLNQ
jgi:predicted HNH restriction endonuclease